MKYLLYQINHGRIFSKYIDGNTRKEACYYIPSSTLSLLDYDECLSMYFNLDV